jgi:RNA polymerase-binding transcription factor DksA
MANKAAPAKKAVVKKAAPKPVAKKAAKPAGKVVATAKKVSAKPAPKKAAAVKKVTNSKLAKNNNHKTVSKKDSKVTPTTKKSTSTSNKVATPAKKTVATKSAPVAKKAVAPAKPAAKTPPPAPAKAAPVKKAAPAPAPAPAKSATKPTTKSAKPVAKKTISAKSFALKTASTAPRPVATPAARSLEKKPQVIIAHRRMENKAKNTKDLGMAIPQYNADTYRSILDEPIPQTGPVFRYSDEDLTEFKELISGRLEAARKELVYLQGHITRKDEAGTEDTENRYMNMEDGSGAMEREQLAQLASRQIQFISHLEKAMVRIENKTYGICRVTGKLIDKARLRAVPHATLSIEAKKTMTAK